MKPGLCVLVLTALALRASASEENGGTRVEVTTVSVEGRAEGTDAAAPLAVGLQPPPAEVGAPGTFSSPSKDGDRAVHLVDLIGPPQSLPSPTVQVLGDINSLQRPGPLSKLFNPASPTGLFDDGADEGEDKTRDKRHHHCKRCKGGGGGGDWGGGGGGGGLGGGLTISITGSLKGKGGGGGGCGYGGCGGGGGGYYGGGGGGGCGYGGCGGGGHPGGGYAVQPVIVKPVYVAVPVSSGGGGCGHGGCGGGGGYKGGGGGGCGYGGCGGGGGHPSGGGGGCGYGGCGGGGGGGGGGSWSYSQSSAQSSSSSGSWRKK